MQNMKWNFLKYFGPAYWSAIFNSPSHWRYILSKPMRIAVAAGRGYVDDDCSSKASALTFYSLLSIVPVLAVAFGIAKGFGFEKHLEKQIAEKFLEQPEISEKLISFAYNTLQNTQSGLIAGVGLILLFWSVLKLLSNIESSFNAIWKVPKARTFSRRLSDYLAMMVFCPIFFATSSSLSVFIVTQFVGYTKEKGVWETVSPYVLLAFHIFPLILSWFLFTAIYYIMPNTRVPFKAAFTAGIIAGTAYQIVQWIYIQFQVGLASYGAIYGSFAALPLFLIWLNFSWLIALAGAEIAYHIEDDQAHASWKHGVSQQQTDARVLGLLVMQQCLQSFIKGKSPPSIATLAQRVGTAVLIVRRLVQQLVDGGLLVEVFWKDGSSGRYQPARDLNSITFKSVFDALNNARQERYLVIYDKEVESYEKTLAEFDALIESASINSPLDKAIPKDS